jgi:hypothetical protein
MRKALATFLLTTPLLAQPFHGRIVKKEDWTAALTGAGVNITLPLHCAETPAETIFFSNGSVHRFLTGGQTLLSSVVTTPTTINDWTYAPPNLIHMADTTSIYTYDLNTNTTVTSVAGFTALNGISWSPAGIYVSNAIWLEMRDPISWQVLNVDTWMNPGNSFAWDFHNSRPVDSNLGGYVIGCGIGGCSFQPMFRADMAAPFVNTQEALQPGNVTHTFDNIEGAYVLVSARLTQTSNEVWVFRQALLGDEEIGPGCFSSRFLASGGRPRLYGNSITADVNGVGLTWLVMGFDQVVAASLPTPPCMSYIDPNFFACWGPMQAPASFNIPVPYDPANLDNRLLTFQGIILNLSGGNGSVTSTDGVGTWGKQ